MTTDNNTQMSNLRKKLFPIANNELKKFLPMSLIMMMILFNYTLMRDTKDSLVNSHPVSDTEVISFLKFWFVTPASIIFVIVFTKLVNVFSSEKIFYIVVTFFLIFFAIFGFIIYPNMQMLHPDIAYIQKLQAANPGMKFFLAIWGMWSYSLFYVMSELWGSSMIGLLFWKFANEIVKTKEAKRFYPMLILLSNVALMASGKTVKYCSQLNPHLPEAVRWGITLKLLTTLILIAGCIAIFTYRWMNTTVLTDKRFYDADEQKNKAKKSKAKMSVLNSLWYIISSPYLMFIALLVLSYGVSIHVVEVVWKKSLKMYVAGNANEYNAIMGDYSFYTGVMVIFLGMFIKGVINRFGWLVGAVITPLVLGGTGLLFLSMLVFEGYTSPILASFGVTALGAAVFMGALQGILSKSTKYSLFDPTKEMAYIPLSDEVKAKGKAAVDVIGGRLGKSGGSLILMCLYLITGNNNINDLIHVVMIIVAITIFVWIFSVIGLNKRYKALVQNPEEKNPQLETARPEKSDSNVSAAPKGGETNFEEKKD